MWVVKIGGSLAQAGQDESERLPHWLELVSQLGGGRVALVPGGGSLANEVRRLQARWHFEDLAAHNMAVHAMAQNAYLMRALQPSLQMASSEAEIRHVLRKGQTALWMPLEMRRDRPDDNTNWQVTADSIALGLARRLNAERLVLVKACEIDRSLSLAQLGAAGIVDARFSALADQAPFPIEVVPQQDLARMRSLLLGDVHVSA
jgi:5-(aminomethyl)-3-furanmethanol phosphate kinase